MPILIFFLPVVCCGLSDLCEKKVAADMPGNSQMSHLPMTLLMLGFVFLMTLGSLVNYLRFAKEDNTREYREIAAYLTQEQLPRGYATFWHANVLTELTNGYADMYVWENTASYSLPIETPEQIDDLYQWLQPVRHIQAPLEGPIFILLTDTEYENWALRSRLDDDTPAFSTYSYRLLRFDSYQDMKQQLEE